MYNDDNHRDDNTVKPADSAVGTDQPGSSADQNAETEKKSKFYRSFKKKENFERYIKKVVGQTAEELAIAKKLAKEKDKTIEKLNKQIEILAKTKPVASSSSDDDTTIIKKHDQKDYLV